MEYLWVCECVSVSVSVCVCVCVCVCVSVSDWLTDYERASIIIMPRGC